MYHEVHAILRFILLIDKLNAYAQFWRFTCCSLKASCSAYIIREFLFGDWLHC